MTHAGVKKFHTKLEKIVQIILHKSHIDINYRKSTLI